jgi:peptidyl-prolyl cis-trans isomerase D
LIESMVRRDGISPASARDRAIDDALFAAEARAALGDDPSVRRAEAAVLAAALVTELAEQSRVAGPIADAEIALATERRWREFDRPAAARTAHAVVRVQDPGQAEAGRALAERIAVSVRGVSAPEDFLAKARSVPAGSLEVRAEMLPAIAADGREVDPSAPPEREPARFDPTYAEAANALASVGDQSPVVRTKFGFHVILLTERVPEQRTPLAERRQLLTADVLGNRARRLLDDTLVRLRALESAQVLPAAQELTAAVKPGP